MSGGHRQPPGYWFGDGVPPLHMRLLERLYTDVIGARAALYRHGVLRRRHPGRPVLVVGNLIAGGSGKTPLTIAIVERLRAAGWTPGVASRGYGREDAAVARWVDANTETRLGGDEPVLIARRTGAKVRVDRDRVAAARALVEAGCDIVVCDDGLQHLPLARDVEIEVIDGRRRYGNGRLLPAGPLREPRTRGDACDFRVLNLGASVDGQVDIDTHGDARAGGVDTIVGDDVDGTDDTDGADDALPFGEWPMRLRADTTVALTGARTQPLSAYAGRRVHAVAGIGDPERFFAMLRGQGIAVVPHAFPDHHRYDAADLAFGNDLPVLMTEKDAVKCAAFADARMVCVPIRAELPEAFWIALSDRLRTHRPPRSPGTAAP